MFRILQIAHVDRMLKEFPWLWAVKRKWEYNEKIVVKSADARDYLDWHISHEPGEGTSWCHVLLSSHKCAEVVSVELEGIYRNRFDVLDELNRRGVDLTSVEYMVTLVGHDEVRMFRAPKKSTFAQMYWADHRAPKAA